MRADPVRVRLQGRNQPEQEQFVKWADYEACRVELQRTQLNNKVLQTRVNDLERLLEAKHPWPAPLVPLSPIHTSFWERLERFFSRLEGVHHI